jgi:predicted permease
LWQDLQYGLRQLRRNPGFAVVAIGALALGIAVNATIFSVVSEMLLRKPPVRDADRLMMVSSNNTMRGSNLSEVSVSDFDAWRRETHVFQAMAAGDMEVPFTLTGGGEAQVVTGDRVTPNYFGVLGIHPVIGRAFLPDEAQPGRHRVVILSHSFWHVRYGARTRIIGQTMQLNGEPYTIIGIMPPGMSMAVFAPQVWTPLVFQPKDLVPSASEDRNLNVFARLQPGIRIKQAQAEMASIAARLAQAHPGADKGWGVTVLSLQEFMIEDGNVRGGLTVLMATVVFVLLIACANIAGLLLARGTAREHEMAIRTAVGANRRRLIRQMIAESLLIGIAGGGTGLVLSVWGIHLLRASLAFNVYARRIADGLYLDRPTLLFTIAASLLTAILFGLAPAVRASKTNLIEGLKAGGRTDSGNRGGSKMRSAIVIGEIALALILITGTGVMTRELVRELTQNAGFNPRHLIIAEINLTGRNYQSPARQMTFFERVTGKLDGLPGIQSVSATSGLPLISGCCNVSFSIEGQSPLPSSQRPLVQRIVVWPGYFRTMQIPVFSGRTFTRSDAAQTPLVAVVNAKFVRRFFPKGNAIGQRIKLDTDHPAWAEIVGIVGNVNRYVGQLFPGDQVYESYLQTPAPDMVLAVRSRLPLSSVAPMVRHAVWSVDKDQPIGNGEGEVMTMSAVANENVGGDKWMASLLGVFAGLALILAAVGIYGVIAHSVSQRTHEIGIRMALGAQESDVVRLVLRQGGLLTLVGSAIGLALALPLPKLFASILNGFGRQGPWMPIIVCLIVATVSLLATYIPARRAATVDPLIALRYQ